MAATITENHLSREFQLAKTSDRTLLFDIVGTEDEAEVKTLLLAAAPVVYLGLQIESVHAEPQGGGIWKGTARYVRLNDNEYTFDTGGGTKHVTQSYSTVNSYAAAGGTAPDFGGAINVTSDRVEGVDIPEAKYEFSETHYFDDTIVTDAYKLALFHLTNRVNDATFRGFAAGECRFDGATGSKRGDEKWAITFKFSCSPNVTGLTIGPFTIDKGGWDYVWFRTETFEDTSGLTLVERPDYAYVEKVFLDGDFSDLGI